ncbi:MAG: M48 family metalloprotease [Acidimicrobiia bacterium]
MNGARLILSLLLVALPAAALPAVRRTRRPRAWALVLAASLGAGFVLFEASLIHASLPLGFTLLGLERLAAACRSLGGHLFGDPTAFGAFAGLLAIVIGGQAIRGVVGTLRANSTLRREAAARVATPVGGHSAVFLPMRTRWAVALPGDTPQVVLSSDLAGKLERHELKAVVRHEVAHLEHHHVRFLLLGAAVNSGMWFLPWRARANNALRLALERWADELASARSGEARADVSSAVRKLASLAPSALAAYRIRALEGPRDNKPGREWAWPTAASATVPLAIGLAVTLVLHLSQVISVAGGG